MKKKKNVSQMRLIQLCTMKALDTHSQRMSKVRRMKRESNQRIDLLQFLTVLANSVQNY